MAYLVGDTYTDYLLLLDSAGDPVTGASLTTEVARDPSGASFTPTITEVEDGSYAVSFALDEEGTWYLQLLHAATDQRFAVSVDADPFSTAQLGSVVSVTGTTRATLRRNIADSLMDLIELEATAGSTTTFTDPLALLDTDHAFRGAEILVTSGANQGEVRRVYDSDEDSQTLTLTPALGTAVAAGVTAELYNLKSVGFRVDAYNRAVNRAILDAFPNNAMLVEDELADAFDADAGVVEIPAQFSHVSQVWYQDPSTGVWCEVPVALSGQLDQDGWAIRHGTLEVSIGGNAAADADGKTIRLVGYGQPAPLDDDTDLTDTDPQWVQFYAAWLLLASRGRKDAEVYALMGLLKNQADMSLAKMSMRPWLNNTVRVR